MFASLRRWLSKRTECLRHRCDYYTHYLAYGPAVLTHEGWHSATAIADRHFRECRWPGANPCPRCTYWEKELRA